jgi:glycosyltransferase involved in cell wall biosynthesis
VGISTLIMTLNEQANLPACLESLAWCDDIVVLDSFSTDQTVEIARAAGARVYQRAWDSELGQRKYGLREIPFKHAWVYTPDADEITPPDLRDEMLAVTGDPGRPEAYFQVRYKNIFMGRWIRRSSLYPTWITRLVRPDRMRFERDVHVRPVADAPAGRLQSHFLHYSFNKGISNWYRKHAGYAEYEAQIAAQSLEKSRARLSALFSRDQRDRRDAVKAAVANAPFRPTLRFLYMFVLRGGFLDGWAGYTYCRMIATYELMIVVTTAEARRRGQGLSI